MNPIIITIALFGLPVMVMLKSAWIRLFLAIYLTALIFSPLARAGVVANTLYLEARGEGKQGIEAVATVIYNRSKGNPEQFEAVCFKPKQFSCYNASKTPVIAPKTPLDVQAMELCLVVERAMYSGEFKPVGEWTHYYNARVCNPSWASKLQDVERIGNHTFGKL